MVSLTSWALSDIGRKRTKNEDSFLGDDEKALFMVADGMGGHKGGEQASRIAIESAKEYFARHRSSNGSNCSQILEGAFKQAAKEVYDTGLSTTSLRGMGTTLSALHIHDHEAYICHIGDSRIYCLREGKLLPLTNDHSLVFEQVQAGLISPEEARTSKLRNIITRAIGHSKNIQNDSFTFPVKINDIFLLCTDGLNNMLTDSTIAEHINQFNLKLSAQELISEANKRGGEDNITVVIVKVSP